MTFPVAPRSVLKGRASTDIVAVSLEKATLVTFHLDKISYLNSHLGSVALLVIAPSVGTKKTSRFEVRLHTSGCWFSEDRDGASSMLLTHHITIVIALNVDRVEKK
jgi:hypothetical protein